MIYGGRISLAVGAMSPPSLRLARSSARLPECRADGSARPDVARRSLPVAAGSSASAPVTYLVPRCPQVRIRARGRRPIPTVVSQAARAGCRWRGSCAVPSARAGVCRGRARSTTKTRQVVRHIRPTLWARDCRRHDRCRRSHHRGVDTRSSASFPPDIPTQACLTTPRTTRHRPALGAFGRRIFRRSPSISSATDCATP